MNEGDARCALLVRSLELAPAGMAKWSAEDSAWASRAATEAEGGSCSDETFLARRARLAIDRLARREHGLVRTLRALTWRPWIGWAIALGAFVLGAASDALGNSGRINVLAPPLLALMAWNLLVYTVIALGKLARLFARGQRTPGVLVQGLARLQQAVAAHARGGADNSIAVRFAIDWARASAGLNGARIARVLHVAAITLASGALAGMYVRGLVFEYRAGWQSTFLDAAAIRHVLDLVLGPASALTGIALPDEARLAAMRMPQANGERAAAWIHLYAVTVALVIVLPRALLALADRVLEHRLARRFPLALDDAYFSALTRERRGEPAVVAIVPYLQPPTATGAQRLHAMLAAALGPSIAPATSAPVAYGDEESAAARLASVSDPAPTLVLALLSSATTPEPDAHGAFLETLATALGRGARLLVVLDESVFLSRFGGDDAVAARRRSERHLAWTRLLAAHECQPLFVDLERGDATLAVRALRDALDRLATAAHATASR